MANKEFFKTPKFRVSFPSLFTATRMKGQTEGKAKFSVLMIFDLEAQKTKEFKAIIDQIEAIKKDTWKKGVPKNFKNPVKRAEDLVTNTGVRYAGCEDGYICIRAQSDFKPDVINQLKEPATEEQLYSGCFAKAQVTPSAFELPANCGITLYLGPVMKVAEGDKLAGQRSAIDVFEEEEIEVESEELWSDDK